ncbi:MAG: response regulator [Spirochaetales bacterium]|nr:response regulator [Spirochaetales bacterium]
MKEKILIVDDSDATRNSMLFSLQQQDFTIFTATNGLEALQIVKNNKDMFLVITDINMPAMNGFQLVEEIRKQEQLSGLPIVVLSVNAENGDQALEKGATAFIIKSSKTAEELNQFIKTYLRK